MIDIAQIGRRVRTLRRRAGCSLETLGELAGVHANTIARLERGDATGIGIQTLDEIGSALGERVDVLIRRSRAAR